MLSIDTKIDRVNSKLSFLNVWFQFSCSDMQTYTPTYVTVKNNFQTNTPVQLCVETVVLGNRRIVKFSVSKIYAVDIDTHMTLDYYCSFIKQVKDAVDYCNSLQIEVPKYVST